MNKKLYAAICLLFFGYNLEAQVTDNRKAENDAPGIFTKVEIEAHTNQKAWADHVRKSIQLPDSISLAIPAGRYTVTVQFIIDKHGSIGQVRAMNDPGYGLAKRAERIILSYKGTWQPASQCGRNVNAYKQQPITFMIPGISTRPNPENLPELYRSF